MSLMLLAAAASSRITTAIGQAQWTTPGTYNWTCPANVYEVSAVTIGAGSNGGGGLGWKNKIPVMPGQTYTVRVGVAFGVDGTGDSYFISLTTVAGKCATAGGTFVGDGGGNGGSSGTGIFFAGNGAGGGGAGGYAGNGGYGGNCQSSGDVDSNGTFGMAGAGGGGGGGGGGFFTKSGFQYVERRWYPGGGGGGVGIFGQGTSGAGGGPGVSAGGYGKGGTAGSGGGSGTNGNTIGGTQDQWPGGNGGTYGGGAGCGYRYTVNDAVAYNNVDGVAQGGAVRLIWGVGRAFPATRTANE